jgi:threonine dehydrogenase-like Zn-dependent dehydrogenase
MKAIIYNNNALKYIASKATSYSRIAIDLSPITLSEIQEPEIPSQSWVRLYPIVSGICGSDLATIFSKSSLFLKDYVSFPFVLGHEIVAVNDVGKRYVVQSILSCEPRGLDLCNFCKSGQIDKCLNLNRGVIKAGLQIGFCASTGGGWAQQLIAHNCQLIEIPDELSDLGAVMVEPTACALHGVLNNVEPNMTIGVIGAGTIGLSTVACLSSYFKDAQIYVGAKWPHQQKLASQLGASWVGTPSNLEGQIRLLTKSMKVKSFLTSGVDLTIDAIATPESFNQALKITRPGGKIVLLGMPSVAKLDLTPLWLRQITLVPAYGYSQESIGQKRLKTFELAIEVVLKKRLESLVSKTYTLENYRQAIIHAAEAGKTGAVKIAFLPNLKKLKTEKNQKS